MAMCRARARGVRQGARLLFEQARASARLRDRLGQLELARVDPLQVGVAAGAGRPLTPSAGVPSAFRCTYSMPASSSAPLSGVFRKSRPPREWQCADVDHPGRRGRRFIAATNSATVAPS